MSRSQTPVFGRTIERGWAEMGEIYGRLHSTAAREKCDHLPVLHRSHSRGQYLKWKWVRPRRLRVSTSQSISQLYRTPKPTPIGTVFWPILEKPIVSISLSEKFLRAQYYRKPRENLHLADGTRQIIVLHDSGSFPWGELAYVGQHNFLLGCFRVQVLSETERDGSYVRISFHSSCHRWLTTTSGEWVAKVFKVSTNAVKNLIQDVSVSIEKGKGGRIHVLFSCCKQWSCSCIWQTG